MLCHQGLRPPEFITLGLKGRLDNDGERFSQRERGLSLTVGADAY